jgi:hypothetical protein
MSIPIIIKDGFNSPHSKASLNITSRDGQMTEDASECETSSLPQEVEFKHDQLIQNLVPE